MKRVLYKTRDVFQPIAHPKGLELSIAYSLCGLGPSYVGYAAAAYA